MTGFVALLSLLGCGGASGEIQTPGAQTPSIAVVFLTQDVPLGASIGLDDVEVRQMPASLAPPGQVFVDIEQVVGRIASSPLYADEIAMSGRLADPESGLSHSVLIPRGMRMVGYAPPDALPIMAGNYIDLWWDPGTGPCSPYQALFVMAPGYDQVFREPDHALLVADKQAPRALAVLHHPTVRRVLRNDTDFAPAEGVGCP